MVLHYTSQVVQEVSLFQIRRNIHCLVGSRGRSVVGVEVKGHRELHVGAYFMSYSTTPSVRSGWVGSGRGGEVRGDRSDTVDIYT